MYVFIINDRNSTLLHVHFIHIMCIQSDGQETNRKTSRQTERQTDTHRHVNLHPCDMHT